MARKKGNANKRTKSPSTSANPYKTRSTSQQATTSVSIDITLSSILAGRTLKQRNLSKFSHNFYDRRKFIKEVIPVVSSNYNNQGNYDHKVHTMILIPGGSGIGKSRSGWELQHLVTHADTFGFEFDVHPTEINTFQEALQNPCYFYIDLKNGYNYIEQFDEKYSADV
jgi:hypothetical protein